MIFKDHFSDHARDYARARPRYPNTLFQYLASLCKNRLQCWDCGTGNGQAARELTPYFGRVIATDASREQLEQADKHPNIEYHQSAAEHTSFANNSFDLVTVAQALHWFDRPAFYREATRVLEPRGVLAVWSYELCRISPDIDTIVHRYYTDIVGSDWPPERRLVADGYRGIDFPFDEVEPPRFEMQADWSLDEYLDYLDSWSASRRYRQRTGNDPLATIRDELREAWETPGEPRPILWPLNLRVGYNPDAV